jgi:nitrate reductase NapA
VGAGSLRALNDIKTMQDNRRDFLKKAALAFASSVLAGSMPGKLLAAEAEGADGLIWQKAPCRFCGTGCGVMVGVKEGRVVAVQGDLENTVNRGLLCAKGYHAGGALYGKDRLTKPLVRKGGKLTEVSWDEAIETIAKEIHRRPETFAVYGSGQWTVTEGYAAMKMMKGGLGNNHVDPNARLCMASAVVGMLTTYGVDEPSGWRPTPPNMCRRSLAFDPGSCSCWWTGSPIPIERSFRSGAWA